jgi:hypothetical protein
MSKRKYSPRKQTSIRPAPAMPHKPMSDQSLVDHLEVIRVILTFPDTVMTAGQIKDLIAMEGSREGINHNQVLHHLCKISVREDGQPVHGHRSRLDGYQEFTDLLKAGVFYRTAPGSFVLDTAASWQGEWHRNAKGLQVRRLRLVGNVWPHLPYKGESRVIPANKAKPADIPAPDKVVEKVLEQIDHPEVVDNEEEYIPVQNGSTPPAEDDISDEEFEAGLANGSIVPESEFLDPNSEILSVPSAVTVGSEFVIRYDGDIVVLTVEKRWPVAKWTF